MITTPSSAYRGDRGGLSRRAEPVRRGNLVDRPLAISLFSAIVWMVAWVAGAQWAVLTASVLCGSLGLRWFWKFTADPDALTRMLVLGSMSLLTLLNIGLVGAWAASTFGLNRDFADSFDFLSLTFGEYAGAMVYSMLFCCVLAAVGRAPFLVRCEMTLNKRLCALSTASTALIVVAVGLCLFVDAVAIGSGVLKFRSIEMGGGEVGKVAWYSPFLNWIFTAQILLNSLCLTRSLSGRRVNWLLLGFSGLAILCSVFVQFNLGRRPLVLALGLYFIYWCWLRRKRPALKFLIPIAVVAALVVPQALVVNNAMRSGGGSATGRGSDVGAAFERGLDEFGDETKREINEQNPDDNFSRRPLVATPLAKSIALDPSVKTYLLGYNIVTSFIWTVPRVIFPGRSSSPRCGG